MYTSFPLLLPEYIWQCIYSHRPAFAIFLVNYTSCSLKLQKAPRITAIFSYCIFVFKTTWMKWTWKGWSMSSRFFSPCSNVKVLKLIQVNILMSSVLFLFSRICTVGLGGLKEKKSKVENTGFCKLVLNINDCNSFIYYLKLSSQKHNWPYLNSTWILSCCQVLRFGRDLCLSVREKRNYVLERIALGSILFLSFLKVNWGMLMMNENGVFLSVCEDFCTYLWCTWQG